MRSFILPLLRAPGREAQVKSLWEKEADGQLDARKGTSLRHDDDDYDDGNGEED